MTNERPFSLADYLAELLSSVEPHTFRQSPAHFGDLCVCGLPPGHGIHAEEQPEVHPELVVNKLTAHVPVSDELAMEYGLIPDTRPPAPKPSWRRRFLWWRQEKVERARMRVGSWIAGVDLNDREDW